MRYRYGHPLIRRLFCGLLVEDVIAPQFPTQAPRVEERTETLSPGCLLLSSFVWKPIILDRAQLILFDPHSTPHRIGSFAVDHQARFFSLEPFVLFQLIYSIRFLFLLLTNHSYPDCFSPLFFDFPRV